MALTRAALREMGVTEKEIIDNIMEAHGAGIETAKEKAASAAELKAQKAIDDLQAKVDSLPADDGKNEWKEKYDTLKGEFDTFKTTVETEKSTETKRAALRTALKTEGANEKLIELLEGKFDLAALEVDGDKIKDWGDLVKPVKERFSEVFGTVETVGAGVATPPKGGGGTSNPFVQGENFSLEAQTKLFRENPQLAREMAAAVGIKID